MLFLGLTSWLGLLCETKIDLVHIVWETTSGALLPGRRSRIVASG